MSLSNMQLMVVRLRVSVFVAPVQRFHTYFLQMIVYFFAGLG